MKIICDAGKGIMEDAACAGCALRGENICGKYEYPYLVAMFATNGDRSDEIHVTDITGCLLKAYLGKVTPVPKKVSELHSLFYGRMFHAGLECLGVDGGRIRAEVDLKYKNLIGRADIIVDDEMIVDFKTTKYIRPDYLPYGSHGMQLNVYAFMAREMGMNIRALSVQYIDPEKAHICKIDLLDHDEMREYVDDRLKILEEAMAGKGEPDPVSSWLCKYCDYQQECPIRR